MESAGKGHGKQEELGQRRKLSFNEFHRHGEPRREGQPFFMDKVRLKICGEAFEKRSTEKETSLVS